MEREREWGRRERKEWKPDELALIERERSLGEAALRCWLLFVE